MELITPGFGLIFWMTLAFAIVFFVLAKFAFPIINRMLKEREEKISNALAQAERTEAEMKNLQANNEALLEQAKAERDEMMAEARRIRDKFIEDSKAKATEESNRIIESAKMSIENERMAAVTEIKNEIAAISIEIAEKILQRELADPESQKKYVDQLLKDLK